MRSLNFSDGASDTPAMTPSPIPAEGAVLYAPLAVHATGVLFSWPVAAVAALLGTVSLVTEDEQNHGQ